ncbi:MAG: PKD domain-containing protein [Sphingobacteriales bacterium]
MKPVLKFAIFILLAGIIYITSCKREYSYEGGPKNNQPPIANAGNDTIIILLDDSVMLNGSASSDPDGSISSYQWTKISGPA